MGIISNEGDVGRADDSQPNITRKSDVLIAGLVEKPKTDGAAQGHSYEKFKEYVHFELSDKGQPLLVDGAKYDKQLLVESLNSIAPDIVFGSATDRQQFIIKVCKAFGQDTSTVNNALTVADIVSDVGQGSSPESIDVHVAESPSLHDDTIASVSKDLLDIPSEEILDSDDEKDSL